MDSVRIRPSPLPLRAQAPPVGADRVVEGSRRPLGEVLEDLGSANYCARAGNWAGLGRLNLAGLLAELPEQPDQRTLRAVTQLAVALRQGRQDDPCTPILERWQAAGRIEVRGELSRLTQGAAVRGNRIEVGQGEPSDLAEGLARGAFNGDQGSRLVEQAAASGERLLHPELLSAPDYLAQRQACVLAGEAELPGAPAAVREAMGERQLAPHHFELLDRSFEHGWSPSHEELRWLAGQIRSLECTDGEVPASLAAGLLDKVERSRPGALQDLGLCQNLIPMLKAHPLDEPALYAILHPSREEVQSLLLELQRGDRSSLALLRHLSPRLDPRDAETLGQIVAPWLASERDPGLDAFRAVELGKASRAFTGPVEARPEVARRLVATAVNHSNGVRAWMLCNEVCKTAWSHLRPHQQAELHARMATISDFDRDGGADLVMVHVAEGVRATAIKQLEPLLLGLDSNAWSLRDDAVARVVKDLAAKNVPHALKALPADHLAESCHKWRNKLVHYHRDSARGQEQVTEAWQAAMEREGRTDEANTLSQLSGHPDQLQHGLLAHGVPLSLYAALHSRLGEKAGELLEQAAALVAQGMPEPEIAARLLGEELGVREAPRGPAVQLREGGIQIGGTMLRTRRRQ